MGSLWLTSTADWLRAAGVTVVEYQGWKTRARSSGGYEPGRPYCCMWHHTASKTDPASDANYMCNVSDSRPIANVLIDRAGTCWVLAAGATNTNGKGRSITFSRGTVPSDSMNSYAFGIEIANNGVGEDYPQAQIDCAFKVSNAINSHLGNQPGDVSTHQFYAPDRKIDPAMGGNNVQGPWHPRECTNSGTWNRDDLVAECKRRGTSVPAPIPKPPKIKEDDVVLFAAQSKETSQYWIGDGIHRRRITKDWSDDFWQFAEWGVGPVVIPFGSDPRSDPPPPKITHSSQFTECAESTLKFLGVEIKE